MREGEARAGRSLRGPERGSGLTDDRETHVECEALLMHEFLSVPDSEEE
jgi:hypothetical protein